LAVTIGVFDGVHRGHRAILKATLARARSLGGEAAVVTFDRHPLAALAPHAAPRNLMTLESRLAEFKKLGFHHAVVLSFNSRLSALTAEQFVRRILVGRLRAASLVVGYDFHFGRNGRGDAACLRRLGAARGFTVTVVPPELDRGEPVSSTRIRRLLALGSIGEATRLLGRPPILTGVRVAGRRLGRRLGFPTVNIRPDGELLPPYGVYFVLAGPDREPLRPGVASLGVRPSVPGRTRTPLLEVHFLRAPRECAPGGAMRAELLHYRRPERLFPNLAALKKGIKADVIAARSFFKEKAHLTPGSAKQ
jgi:riboflavin kinase/FMN adenylyltransferase